MKVYENVQQSSAFDMSEMMGDGAMDMMMLGGAMEMGLDPESNKDAPPGATPGVGVEVKETQTAPILKK
jgi:hypothetical protein